MGKCEYLTFKVLTAGPPLSYRLPPFPAKIPLDAQLPPCSGAEGATCFFTVVTFNRLPLLTTDAGRTMLHDAWLDVQ